MDYTPNQHYGLTISFSIVRSEFKGLNIDSPTQTIIRAVDKIMPHSSVQGYWCCIFEETKKPHQSAVELYLSLSWIPGPETSRRPPSSLTQSGATESSRQIQDFIKQIRSVKIWSDSTLSELLVGQMDGSCLVQGESIMVRLQSDRVLRNNRYKFRIGFYTQGIPRSRCLEHPAFICFHDIDPGFDPRDHWRNEPLDIIFHFPVSRFSAEPSTIQAHSSALEQSRYFAQRIADTKKQNARGDMRFDGVTCTITEFSPAIFRVMLQYLYTGHLKIRTPSREVQEIAAVGSSMGPELDTECLKIGPCDRRTRKGCAQGSETPVPGAVYFEDLYRISERYEIPGLKALSLKAMQCTMKMSIAVAMLAKLPYDPREVTGEILRGSDGRNQDENERFDMIQVELAMGILKEYIRFFGCEASFLITERREGEAEPTTEGRLEMIGILGDCVLRNIHRFWE
ncbi:hypothetical protein BC939DRAFT_505792 [Gamsiella multidivaricata]|uniref:uncharacterized protein n=1 Tax=Gamsiella multidivaricata TaxID=101098 RepID=UPI00221F10E0|nr:uncharacterized protein BC939DRAFT_505792 [Gamsiella multidivaricata]KAI7819449.1 hypothetical protein BC939DRAFT_505792 [Gamsiella multidivaricata]